MELAKTQAARWHSLSVSTSNRQSLLEFHCALEQVYVPILHRFNEFLREFPPEYSNSTVFEPGAPELREVRLHGLSLDRCMPPLGAVKKLTLFGGDEFDTRLEGSDAEYYWEQSLKEMKNVGEIYLYNRAIEIEWHEEWTVYKEIQVPSLRKLAIIERNYGDDYDPLCVFQAMRNSNLVELHLVGWLYLAPFFRFITTQTNQPRLSSVQLLDMRIMEMKDLEQEQLLGFMHQTPGVKHLITNRIYLEAFLASVTSAEGDLIAKNVWTDLVTLTFDGTEEKTVMEEVIPLSERLVPEVLREFVEKRFEYGHPLKIVRLTRDFIEGTDVAWLEDKVDVVAYDNAELIRFEELIISC
ncbi:hypothetical protein AX16_006854 [Volvariella volvacea WC 439]|nr:hypothetical protein AX16_006854 [Volvariella volvacea WC 439]